MKMTMVTSNGASVLLMIWILLAYASVCMSFRESERQREQEPDTRHNPFFFPQRSLHTRYEKGEGEIRVLGKFAERSELLRGIENYRMGMLVANPNTFVLPHYIDAEAVLVVIKGNGVLTIVREGKRESFETETGDAIRVPAGSTIYWINKDSNEELRLASLFQPINSPDQHTEFFPTGGENPESVYSGFSSEILEAALQAPREEIKRIFGNQRDGVIIRANPVQIQTMTGKVSSKHKDESKWTINVLNQKPVHSNNFGQFFEVCADKFKQFKDMDVSIAFSNITQGGMMVPYFNTKATKLIMVIDGSGYYEMVIPNIESQRQGQRMEEGGRNNGLQTVRSNLSPGDVFIMPAGHPMTIVASQNENLQLMSFGVHATNNERVFLVGKENIINQLDREAIELAFGIPAREVEQVFSNSNETYFMAGPQRGGQQRGEEELATLLDLVSV
ncbi:unnamed protein product [Rhodiola kirilowii]